MRSSERAATPPASLAPRAGTRRVFARYLAFQAPEWLIVGMALLAAVRWWQLREAIAWSILVLFVAKDLLLFPFVRNAYEPNSGSAADALVGRRAVARDALTPTGYVHVGSELWAAELRNGGAVPPGVGLRVVEVRGLTLIVDPVEEEPSP